MSPCFLCCAPLMSVLICFWLIGAANDSPTPGTTGWRGRVCEEAFHRARQGTAVGGPQDRRYRGETHGGRRRCAFQPAALATQDEHHVPPSEGMRDAGRIAVILFGQCVAPFLFSPTTIT